MPYQWSLDEAARALEAGDRGPCRQWLEGELAGRAAVNVADFAVFESGSWWNSDPGSVDSRGRTPADVVEAMVGVAASRPEAAALLLLYVRFEVGEAWEQSWTVAALGAMIEAARRGWVRSRDAAAPADRLVGDEASALVGLLAREIDTETISAAGSLRDWSSAAGEVAEAAAAIETRAVALAPGPLAAAVRRAARTQRRYYRAVARAAEAADEVCRTGHGDLGAAIGELAEVESVSDPRDSSELRAHRLALQALQAARERPWLRVEHGRILAVYPFGIRDVTPRQVVETARAEGLSWTLSDVPVVAVRANLPVNDIWDGDDALERSYTGTALRLPEAYLGEPHEPDRLVIRPQVWLSDLGNHSLRLELVVSDADPQRLFDLLKLTSPEAGDLSLLGRPIRSHMAQGDDGPATWPSMLALAAATVNSLQVCLREAVSPKAKVAFSSGTERVVLTVDQAVSWDPNTGERRPVDSLSTLADCFGYRLLSHPIDVGVHAIAQWAAYGPGVVDDVPVHAGSPVRLVVTDNSAVVAAFGRPSWAVDVLVDVVTFAFTLGGLFESWHQEIAAFHYNVMLLLQRLRTRMDDADVVDEAAHAEVLDIQAQLQRRQFEMHEFLAGARASLLFISSPSLVSSPMIRMLVDQVLDRTGFARLRHQFDTASEGFVESRVATALAALERQVSRAATVEQRRRDARSRLIVDALLAAVAVTGVAGVASLVQSGYDIGPEGSTWLIAVVIALAAAIGGLTLWAGRRTSS